MKPERIFIVGYGAIGKSLAVFLKQHGRDVIILRGSADNESVSQRNIQVMLSNGQTTSAQVEVATLSNFTKLEGIIVLTNKSFGNTALATSLKSKAGNSPIVLLQNGLGVERPFVQAGFSEIYRCVVFVTSQSKGADGVTFKPVSPCPIGSVKGNFNRLTEIVTQLHTSEFQFRVENEIEPIIWKKTIANIVFNSICPLLDVDNGIFYRDEKVLHFAQRIVQQCLVVSNKQGIKLSYDEVMEGILLISKASDGQLISTLQDIRNKRPTEIDTLNFEIVRIAEGFGEAEAVKDVKLLGELILLKSGLV